MPRQARIDYPGALHHVMCRAVEQKDIFCYPQDKEEFVTRLEKLLRKSSMQCYAWSVMDNHFHLLLLTGETSLSEFMRRLLTGYAVCYNKVHRRAGHLFQNRYKSIICDRDSYLQPLIRYIHLNPVRVKKVTLDELVEYKWTGHGELLGKNKRRIINHDEVLGFFGKTEKEARKLYREYIFDGIGKHEDYRGGGLVRSAGGMHEVLRRKKDNREIHDDRILGGGDFVADVYRHLDKSGSISAKILDVDIVLDKISGYFRIDKEELMNCRSKNVRKGRSVAIYLLNKYCGISLTEAGKLCGIQQSAASIAMRRGKELCADKNIEKNLFDFVNQ